MPENIKKTIKDGELPEMHIRKKDETVVQKLFELCLDTKEARN